jgi:predicted enzyme related to lactoylglutathione lyase
MPTAKGGKICYIEMPTKDAQASADFYQRAFGWTIRTRGDGAIAFDDTTGEVSGAFVLGRAPAAAPGLMVYIMVDNVVDAMKKVEANGGEIVQAIGGDAGEITARFRDPGGNVIGLYQEPV